MPAKKSAQKAAKKAKKPAETAWEVSPRVRLQALADARAAEGPVARPLRIYALDPSVSNRGRDRKVTPYAAPGTPTVRRDGSTERGRSERSTEILGRQAWQPQRSLS